MALRTDSEPSGSTPGPERPEPSGAAPGPDQPHAAPGPDQPHARPFVPPAPRVTHRRFLRSRRRQAIAGLVILAAIGFVVYQGLGNATEYFLTANQAVANRASLGTKQFRIEGTVESDIREGGGQTTFNIYAGGDTVPVVDSKDPPQLFKAGIPVVLEGHWSGTTFTSDLIMVKHSASYTEAHPDRLKSQLPSTPTTLAGVRQ